jgi:hypothetical protein
MKENRLQHDVLPTDFIGKAGESLDDYQTPLRESDNSPVLLTTKSSGQ